MPSARLPLAMRDWYEDPETNRSFPGQRGFPRPLPPIRGRSSSLQRVFQRAFNNLLKRRAHENPSLPNEPEKLLETRGAGLPACPSPPDTSAAKSLSAPTPLPVPLSPRPPADNP